MALYRFAQVVLTIWLIYRLVVLIPDASSYGIAAVIGAYIGSNLADLRTWLLVVALLLLRWKLKRKTT